MTELQYIERFVPQAKILRVFLMINHMAVNKSSIRRIAQVMDTTERTVYRYLVLLDAIGFQVMTTGIGDDKKYFIGHDYYPAFISFFREDVWKIKARIRETPDQSRKRQLMEQEVARA